MVVTLVKARVNVVLLDFTVHYLFELIPRDILLLGRPEFLVRVFAAFRSATARRGVVAVLVAVLTRDVVDFFRAVRHVRLFFVRGLLLDVFVEFHNEVFLAVTAFVLSLSLNDCAVDMKSFALCSQFIIAFERIAKFRRQGRI
jgi:hypothetical protein